MKHNKKKEQKENYKSKKINLFNEEKIKRFYEKNTNYLMLIPSVLFIISLFVIYLTNTSTGSFILKDISLKGGTTITIHSSKTIDIDQFKKELESKFKASFEIRKITESGKNWGYIIETELSKDKVKDVLNEIQNKIGKLDRNDYSIQEIGASLGKSFFKEIIIAMIFAFVLMAISVFLIFRNIGPSLAVISAALFDITMTIAALDLLKIKLSTAGIAALLMLIGYSVDTDILLSTRVLKNKTRNLFDNIISAMKTGLTMTTTTLAAVLIAYLFTTSFVLKQIMLIILIGLVFDLINTWFFNTGILIKIVNKSKKR